jgi:hypothetical protein
MEYSPECPSSLFSQTSPDRLLPLLTYHAIQLNLRLRNNGIHPPNKKKPRRNGDVMRKALKM